MLFVGTAHFPLCCPKLHKAAAFSAGAFAERGAFAADIQPAAVFVFVSFFAFGNDCDQVLYFGVDAVGVDALEKAFFAEGTVHGDILLSGQIIASIDLMTLYHFKSDISS